MAVTINNSPLSLSAVYNPVVYSVSSTNTGQTNFKFIADIYVNGSATPLPRIKYPCVPNQNYQAIEIGGILKNYLTRDPFVIGDKGFKTDSNSILQVTVQFGEEYGASSGVTSYPNLAQDSTVFCINASLAYPDFVKTLSSYIVGGVPKKFLTASPRSLNIGSLESNWIYLYNPTQAANKQHYEVVIIAYDVSGNILNTVTVSNPYTAPASTSQKHIRFGCGTYELSILTAPDITSGSIPVIPAATNYYKIFTREITAAITSEVVTFNIVSKCSKASTNYRLVWLNSLGGYDALTFYGQNQKTSSIERKMYKKYAGYFNSNVFTYDNQNSRQNSQYNTIAKDNIKITSDWITEAESTWLEELFTSPDVYYISGTELIPINVQDNGYVFKSVSRDELFNIELNFAPCYERMRQQF